MKQSSYSPKKRQKTYSSGYVDLKLAGFTGQERLSEIERWLDIMYKQQKQQMRRKYETIDTDICINSLRNELGLPHEWQERQSEINKKKFQKRKLERKIEKQK